MIVKCKTCGKDFNKKLSEIKRTKNHYCTAKCRSEGRKTGKYYDCSFCGRPVFRTLGQINKNKSANVFCNSSCACSFNNGLPNTKKHYSNWQGTNYTKVAFELYAPECAICGYNNLDALNVHHIDSDRKNNCPDNLIILCANHHSIVHKGSLEITESIKQSRKLL